MSSAINSTDAISMKNYLIDSLSQLSTITTTLGRKFIDGHHADNHLKNYEEFETYLEINKFSYPIFYDYKGECNKQNKLPQHVFYQTFLLDENNKVLLIGKPTPGSNLWNLYKKIISQ